jgi:hypothetical protein
MFTVSNVKMGELAHGKDWSSCGVVCDKPPSTLLYYKPGSSVSIVSDYGLDDRGSIPDRGRVFSL